MRTGLDHRKLSVVRVWLHQGLGGVQSTQDHSKWNPRRIIWRLNSKSVDNLGPELRFSNAQSYISASQIGSLCRKEQRGKVRFNVVISQVRRPPNLTTPPPASQRCLNPSFTNSLTGLQESQGWSHLVHLPSQPPRKGLLNTPVTKHSSSWSIAEGSSLDQVDIFVSL